MNIHLVNDNYEYSSGKGQYLVRAHFSPDFPWNFKTNELPLFY